ncbi:MAG: hypothetical protein WBB36_12060 [Chitinophagales bacterium]
MTYLKNYFLASLLLLTTVTLSRAQMGMGKPEEIAELKKRKLIVILEEPSQKVIDKLKKKGKSAYIDDYKAAVEEFNNNLKAMMEENWTYHETWEYKSSSTAEALKKAKNKQYAVIWIAAVSATSNGASYTAGLNWSYSDVKEGVEESKEGSRDLSSTALFIVALSEEFLKVPVFQIGMPRDFPLKADLLFAIKSTIWYMDARLSDAKTSDLKDIIKNNGSRLKTYTLFINKEDLGKNVTASVIKSAYPYAAKILEPAQFDDQVIAQAEKTAILVIVPMMSTNSHGSTMAYVPYVMDVKSGELLSYVMPSAGSYMTAMSGVSGLGNPYVTERVMKEVKEDAERVQKK